MRLAASDKETSNVVPKRQADPQSQTGRLSLQGVRVRDEEKEENLLSEEGQGMTLAKARRRNV
jgi:hypothetical protein